LYASILVLFTSNAYAQTNLFAPKKDGVSEQELNKIVEKRLNDQRNELTNNFNQQIKQVESGQSATFNEILKRLDALQQENAKLKESQELIKEEAIKAAEVRSRNSFIKEPSNSYSVEEVNEELRHLVETEDPDKVLVMDEDIQRLNKEFGEEGLKFVAILGEQKIYKNSNGEYIVKHIDFEAPVVSSNDDYADAPAQ
jgi:hypothetical protein